MSVQLPEPGRWPCQHTEHQDPPPRLLAALYVLMRDHVQAGDLEQVMLMVVDHDSASTFTNPNLEAYARSLCTYLLTGMATFPRMDGETQVLGPGIVATLDGSVLNWNGVNYTPQEEQ